MGDVNPLLHVLDLRALLVARHSEVVGYADVTDVDASLQGRHSDFFEVVGFGRCEVGEVNVDAIESVLFCFVDHAEKVDLASVEGVAVAKRLQAEFDHLVLASVSSDWFRRFTCERLPLGVIELWLP